MAETEQNPVSPERTIADLKQAFEVMKSNPKFKGDVQKWQKVINEDSELAAAALAFQERDSLTGIYNKEAFLERAKAMQELDPPEGKHLVAIYGDTDGLRMVNSNQGREAGDVFIRYAARAFDQADIDGIVGKMGSDEFVILTYVSNEGGAEDMMKRISDTMDKGRDSGEITALAKLNLTSVDIPKDADIDSLLKSADNSLSKKTAAKKEKLKLSDTPEDIEYLELMDQISNLEPESVAKIVLRLQKDLASSLNVLKQKKTYDGLTGLVSTEGFTTIMGVLIHEAERNDTPISIINLDLQKFKDVNDTMGHVFGDRVLKAFADFLSDNKRASDIAVRFSGDEFCLVLPNTDEEGANIFLEHMTAKLKKMKEDADEGDPVNFINFHSQAGEWESGMSIDDFLMKIEIKKFEQARK